MTLESCDTSVRVTKRYRELIPGLWTGNGERSWTDQRWYPWQCTSYCVKAYATMVMNMRTYNIQSTNQSFNC